MVWTKVQWSRVNYGCQNQIVMLKSNGLIGTIKIYRLVSEWNQMVPENAMFGCHVMV